MRDFAPSSKESTFEVQYPVAPDEHSLASCSCQIPSEILGSHSGPVLCGPVGDTRDSTLWFCGFLLSFGCY